MTTERNEHECDKLIDDNICSICYHPNEKDNEKGEWVLDKYNQPYWRSYK